MRTQYMREKKPHINSSISLAEGGGEGQAVPSPHTSCHPLGSVGKSEERWSGSSWGFFCFRMLRFNAPLSKAPELPDAGHIQARKVKTSGSQPS